MMIPSGGDLESAFRALVLMIVFITVAVVIPITVIACFLFSRISIGWN